MPKTKPPYPAEFRQRMAELPREFERSAQTIITWVAQAARDGGGRCPARKAEQRRARGACPAAPAGAPAADGADILAKATAWFAVRGEKTVHRVF